LEHSISFMWIMPASLLVSMSVSYAGGFFFPAPRRVSLGTLEGQRMPYSPPSGQD